MKRVQVLDIPQTLEDLCDPQRMALVVYDMQVGVAMEIGIEPTAHHAADLGIVPVIVEDACGSGHAEAAQRSIESLKFAGDAVFTDVEKFCQALKRKGG